MIKCFATRFVAAALGLMMAAGNAMAQGYGTPTLLPLPPDVPAYPGHTATSGGSPLRAVQHQVQLGNEDEESPTGAVPLPPSDDDQSSSPSDLMGNGIHTNGRAAAPCGCDANGGVCADNACGCATDSCEGDWLANWCGPGCNCGWFGSVGGMVLTRDMILNRIWLYSPDVESRVVDVYMGYLRKKIDNGHQKKLLHSVRGFGYTIKE